MIRFYMILLLTCWAHVSFAQTEHTCSVRKKNQLPLRGGNVLQDPGNLRSDTLDVLSYEISLDMTQILSASFTASCKIDLVALMNDVDHINLDLLSLQVDSVITASSALEYNHSGELLRIDLPQALNTGDTYSLTVYYHGNPALDDTWGGFYFSSGYAFNLGVAFTSVPHNFGRAWFPCFDNFVERSSYTFHVLTNGGRTAYCNGLRLAVDSLGGDSLLTHWHLEEEIPTYLASVAVSSYVHAADSFESIGGEEIPIWLAARAIDTLNMKQSMVNLPACLSAYEERFGAYRWPRVGFVAVPFNSGAMEHSTNIAYPLFAVDGSSAYETLWAHELSHQWWGDQVTCRNAGDMWLNEGWASFCEGLYMEIFYGQQEYIDYVRDNHKDVLQFAHRRDGDRYPISGVPYEITYGDHVYNKGADVAHCLRSVMGDDSFFEACRNWLDQRQFTDVSSGELRDFFQNYTPQDLGAFFENWVFSPGFTEFRVDGFNQSPEGNWLIDVRQFAHYAPDLYSNLPLTISAYSTNGEFVTQDFIASGAQTIVNMNLPEGFTPQAFFINRNDALSLAVLAQEDVITSTGINNMNYAEMELTVNELGGADSIWIRVENHWAVADENLVQGDYYLSPDRWWNVFHTGGEGNDMTAVIKYYGNPDDNKYFDPNFFAYLEDNAYNEDSLKLMYRSSPADEWTVYPDYEVLTSPGIDNWTGRIRIFGLKSGQYAWAVRYGAVGHEEAIPAKVRFYYTAGCIAADLPHENASLLIYDTQGRIMREEKVNGSTQIACSNWAPGVYHLQWKGKDQVVRRSIYISHQP